MNKFINSSAILLALFSLAPFSYSENNNSVSLTIKVDLLQNSKGIVQFSLYNKEGSIPDEEYQHFYLKQNGNIRNGSSTTTFYNLPKGRYAVNILHDENMNGKIDKGFILPTEGVGFTNYSTISLTNRPNFDKASFEVDQDTEKSIQIIYF
ncbi:MAG: hypothetical protein ISEC1_P1061 [Thiomicrorhabdus sp.]|nr:MAG: hypothetical protein ISEC1_P1061 [Thiomicrorhabdus sp.]